MNGTYIRNKDFVFERVGRKVIEKDTIIRLGSDDTIRSLQFMAVRLVAGPKDFSFEFGLLKSKWDGLMERRDKLEKQIALMSYLPVGASVLLLGATISVNDIHVIRGVMFLPSILSPVINTFGKKKLKKLNEEVKHTFVCPNPNCGMPLTETEVKLGKCLKYVARGCRWIQIASLAGDTSAVDFRNIFVKNIRIIGSTLRSKTPEEKGRLLSELVEKTWCKFESGDIKVKIYKTFPLEKADEAQQVLYRGENVGKVVLIVKENSRSAL